jgi:hypothetical protein
MVQHQTEHSKQLLQLVLQSQQHEQLYWQRLLSHQLQSIGIRKPKQTTKEKNR